MMKSRMQTGICVSFLIHGAALVLLLQQGGMAGSGELRSETISVDIAIVEFADSSVQEVIEASIDTEVVASMDTEFVASMDTEDEEQSIEEENALESVPVAEPDTNSEPDIMPVVSIPDPSENLPDMAEDTGSFNDESDVEDTRVSAPLSDPSPEPSTTVKQPETSEAIVVEQQSPSPAPAEEEQQAVHKSETPPTHSANMIASANIRPQRPVSLSKPQVSSEHQSAVEPQIFSEPEAIPEPPITPDAEDLIGNLIAKIQAEQTGQPVADSGGTPSINQASLIGGEGLRLRNAIAPCWSTAALSTEAAGTTVIVKFSLTIEGMPDGPIDLESHHGGSAVAAAKAFEAARRAIRNCLRKGIDLPRESYGNWRSVAITFNPELMSLR